MTKKYGVLYCRWDSENVIKSSGVFRARNLEEAIEYTNDNFELNVVIPLNKSNKKYIKKLLG